MYTLLWEALTGQHATPVRAAQLLEKRFSGTDKQRQRRAREPLVLVLDELDYLVSCRR